MNNYIYITKESKKEFHNILNDNSKQIGYMYIIKLIFKKILNKKKKLTNKYYYFYYKIMKYSYLWKLTAPEFKLLIYFLFDLI